MENYEPLEVIGSGSFGVIRKVRRRSDGKILARKEINYGKMTEKEKLQLVSEVNILRELRHPNIVRYYERYVDKEQSRIYIVMEYCEGGDLASLIKKCRKELRYIEEELVWKIFAQVVVALHECHSFRHGTILHRDLKPENIFMDAANNVKLGDFGLSRVLGHQRDLARTFVGTPYYMSPEQVNESGYDIKSDVWSLGCLLYELCALTPPFDGPNQAALSSKIRLGRFNRVPVQYSEDINRVIRFLLQTDPNKRPTAAELLSVPQINLVIQERNFHLKVSTLKRKAEEIGKAEERLKKRERELDDREKLLNERESRIKDVEARLRDAEARLAQSTSSKASTPRQNPSSSGREEVYQSSAGSREKKRSPFRDYTSYYTNSHTQAQVSRGLLKSPVNSFQSNVSERRSSGSYLSNGTSGTLAVPSPPSATKRQSNASRMMYLAVGENAAANSERENLADRLAFFSMKETFSPL